MAPVPSAPQRTAPIGVFDSGVGGLTVLHELLVALPQEDFLYLGDSARFPYGDRTPEELRAFSRQIADALLERGAKLLVVACNSATSSALADVTAHVAARAAGASTSSASSGRSPTSPSRRRATGASACSPRRRRSPAAPTSARCSPPTRSCG